MIKTEKHSVCFYLMWDQTRGRNHQNKYSVALNAEEGKSAWYMFLESQNHLLSDVYYLLAHYMHALL